MKYCLILLCWPFLFNLTKFLLKIPKRFSSYNFSLFLKSTILCMKIRVCNNFFSFALIANGILLIFYVAKFLYLLKNRLNNNLRPFRVMTTFRNYDFFNHFLLYLFDRFDYFLRMLTRNDFVVKRINKYNWNDWF